MTKKAYSDARWHDVDMNFKDELEYDLSEAEKEKRIKFLNELHFKWFGTPLADEIPDNLRSKK